MLPPAAPPARDQVRKHREEIARIERPELLEGLQRRQEALASGPKAMLNLETAEIMDPTKATVSAGSWKGGDSVLDGAVGLEGVLGEVLVGNIELEVRVEHASGKATSVWTRQLSADEIAPEGMWLHFSARLPDVARGNLSPTKRHVPTLTGRLLGTGRPDPLGVVVWRKPTPRPAKQAGKPNVILISLDTLRADHLGIAGYDRDTTPNLDEIAKEGLWFDTVVSQQVRTIDIYPTVLELAGLPVPDHVDGASLLPLARRQAEEERAAYSGATAYGPKRESIRYRDWKLVRTLGPHAVQGAKPTGPARELYDLAEDPGERLNLAERRAEVTTDYLDLLDEIVSEAEATPRPGPAPEEDPDIDPQLLEQLRSLGYVDN